MNENKARELANWLKTLERVQNVEPVKVTIGKRVFYGAVYSKDNHPNWLYLLGELPKTLNNRRLSKVCYTVKADKRFTGEYELYRTGYIDESRITYANRQYHPFGAWFGITEWNLTEPIGKYEPFAYTRVEMSIEYLSDTPMLAGNAGTDEPEPKNETLTIQQFIESRAIRMIVAPVPKNPHLSDKEWAKTASHYCCTLIRSYTEVYHFRNERGDMVNGHNDKTASVNVYYSMGSAHKNPPTSADVLDCLAMEALDVESYGDDWRACAKDLGYEDEDLRAFKQT